MNFPGTDDIDKFAEGVKNGDRRSLAKAITLVESLHPKHRSDALRLVDSLLPFSGGSVRLGITGVPGVGKSTFIETLGIFLIEAGYRVAVLAVDPSSRKSRGSVLGDKTRMQELVTRNEAFVRPSPSGGTLGGVASKTREAMLLCEAAGYDVVLVETVGVGQSETAVASMVDFFLVLMLSGAGDELQGIKKGIIEHADCIAINKADGDNLKATKRARLEYQRALHYFLPESTAWTPVVTTCSAVEKTGISEIWDTVLKHREDFEAKGLLAEKRERQILDWLERMIDEEIRNRFYNDPVIREKLPGLRNEVRKGSVTPATALNLIFAG